MEKMDIFLSIIVPLHNDRDILPGFLEELINALQGRYTNHEIVLIDDGSLDGTSQLIDKLISNQKCIRYIRLAKHYGHEIALGAALDAVIGDYAVVLVPSTDPPDIIPFLIAHTQEGSDIIFGVAKNRKNRPWFRKAGGKAFSWYCAHVLKFQVPENSTSLLVFSRKAINALVQIKTTNRYSRFLSMYTGFKSKEVEYEQISRRKKEGDLKEVVLEVKQALDIIFSHSMSPLYVLTGLGLLASFLNLLYILYVLVVFLLKDDVVEGWTTLSLQTSVMFFMVFLILAVLSKYIGDLVKESKQRPPYYIEEEKNSLVLIEDKDQKNIVS